MRRITWRGVVARTRRGVAAFRRTNAPTYRALPLEAFPAGYVRWARRRSNKLRGAIPDRWAHVAVNAGDSPQLAVVIHVYYPELVPELADLLENVPTPFDVIVTDASGQGIDPAVFQRGLARSVRVYPVENRGRDMWPLVQLVNAELLDPYSIVLKLHTKRSAWRGDHPELQGDGAGWRKGLLGDLIGSRSQAEAILSEFADRPGLGLVTARGSILDKEFWGGNRHIVEALLLRFRLRRPAHQLEFAAGSMYWIRAFVLQGLRALELTADDFESELGQIDGTTAHGVERLVGVLTKEAGYRLDEAPSAPQARDSWRCFTEPPRERGTAIAFYLPQFHSFAENNRWWGEGFTEWSNVAAAEPLFAGHTQPLLPADLGFYDLTDPRILPRQAALAQAHGIQAFMYYHYWFAGKPLMESPLQHHFASDVEMPYCLMWANENWTRRWDGGATEVLVAQEHETVPPELFIDSILDYLADQRYVTIDGRPVLAVYKLNQLPDPAAVVARWRARVQAAGLPGIYVLSVDVGAPMDGSADANTGVDGFMEFAPHNMPWVPHDTSDLEIDPQFEGNIMDYSAMVDSTVMSRAGGIPEDRYPGVMVNFDNTARRQWHSDLWLGSNPYTFRRWLRSTLDASVGRAADKRMVFINAWNEWAECAVLEPSQRFGKTYLLAVRDALRL